MSPEKGFIYALQATRQLVDAGHTNFSYTMIGTGIQFAELKRFAQAAGLDGVVRFAGEKTRAEVAAALQDADVFILPSVVTEVWAETQATVVQEALLMGCLTLTTEAGGVPESNAAVMRQFGVPPADSAALAEQMLRLLSLDAGEMAKLGAEGRAFACQRYDIRILMDRILSHARGQLGADDPSRYLRS
jgi:colanic acid/amylovoran biosynthesis glycosyltransferase